MSDNILITGATGNIGSAVAAHLLKASRPYRLTALVRAKSIREAWHRLETAIGIYAPEIHPETIRNRVEVLVGDISEPQLGIPSNDYSRLSSLVTHILHSAACTSFHTPLDRARLINCEGTRNVIEFAGTCHKSGNLRKMAYVSTAYVCGHDTAKVVSENDFSPAPDAANAYERSKWEAERLVRDHFQTLPLIVLRPSIVVGHSRTGRIVHLNVLYPPLKYLLTRSGINPDIQLRGQLDIVPLDYVADAIVHLVHETTEDVGRTYHLVAGQACDCTVRDMLLSARVAADRLRNMYGSIGRSETAGQKITSTDRVLRRLKTYAPYLDFPGTFDSTNTQRALASTRIRVRPVTQYMSTLLSYAFRTHWGQRPLIEETRLTEKSNAHRRHYSTALAAHQGI
jgi:long-chain acyl-CoA synthetase